MTILRYTKTNENARLVQPGEGDAGYDICTPFYVEVPPVRETGLPVAINTHLQFQYPEGYWAKIFDRSSVAKRGVFTTAGVIDNGYRGDTIVLLTNYGHETVVFEQGEKIAQLVLMPLSVFPATSVTELNITSRGDGGFGSTGRF